MTIHQKPIISVLGGSGCQVNTPIYIKAYELGKLLANCGFKIAVGGCKGIMEAAGTGAAWSTPSFLE